MNKNINIATSIAMASALVACSDNSPPQQTNQDMSGTMTENAVADNTNEKLVLGLTMRQLRDADIVNAEGFEIGEVERIISDASGTVTNLLVEVEDSDPDHIVEISLDGLTAKQSGDDWDLVTTMSKEDLMALPGKK